MDIEGTYTLQAPMEEVWQCLMDQQMLRHAIPGLEHLESTGEHTYAFTLRIKQAPLRGVYQGQVMMDNLRYPISYRLSLEGDGQHGTFRGIWDIRLSPQQDNTVVAYIGTLNPGKLSALLPPSLVKGTIKILIQQFFTSMAEQLRTTTGAIYLAPAFDVPEGQTEYDDTGNDAHVYNGHSSMEESLSKRTLLHTLVRQVGLGNYDPLLEDLWVTRLKRLGAFSVLLLLVWVGTRLPRRLLPHN